MTSRQMSTLTQRVKEEDDSCIVQAEKPKFSFLIRPATEVDIPELKKIRGDMGIHDAPTVFQTFMKLDPKGFKIAVSHTGNSKLIVFLIEINIILDIPVKRIFLLAFTILTYALKIIINIF